MPEFIPSALELSAERLNAAIAAFGRLTYFGTPPELVGETIWVELCRAHGLDAQHPALISFANLECALHTLGPWQPGGRCDCGSRTREIWRRAADLAVGTKPQTIAEVENYWTVRESPSD